MDKDDIKCSVCDSKINPTILGGLIVQNIETKEIVGIACSKECMSDVMRITKDLGSKRYIGMLKEYICKNN